MTDSQLLQTCRQYGENAKKWRQLFLGLLPEVNARQLYLQENCSSIFEYAFKVGGVTMEQVKTALRLDRTFSKTPQLHTLLTEGKVSLSKLSRIASIAKPDNENFLASQVQILSKSALDTLAKDEKHDVQPLPGQSEIFESPLELNEEITHRLGELKRRGIDINTLLTNLLDKNEIEMAQKKEKLAHEQEEKGKSSRYIPAAIQNILKKEFGTKCSIVHCQNQSQNIHHTQRYAISHNHNPNFLSPLCLQHHEIAHAIDVRVMEKRKGLQFRSD